MATLDPEVRDLLAVIHDLDERTRGDLADDYQRSLALAHLGGVMRAVLVHGVEPHHATATITAWKPTREPIAEEAPA